MVRPGISSVEQSMNNAARACSLMLTLSLIGPGCAGSPSAPAASSSASTSSTTTSAGSSAGSSGATTADLAFCVTETNRYRAMVGATPLTQSSALEAFADGGAREDSQAAAAHQHFDRLCCVVATAENELYRLPYGLFASIQGAIRDGLAGFFSEGPGGGHYENIVGRFTQVGCGAYRAGTEITLVQDFR